ncbi:MULTISPECIES: acyl carrier protein [unclassified Micromonospora]|uniref:acyl carrier protein n=1 Tax=unclassified Micromonospora TaxID=2617518 RepID=UPI0022CC4311|nr:acyl carrier protein [Micromonospora sp. AKA38]GHJ15426.1 hypothetical protein TPA0908_34210 [Micromonospora sp. AKA38]
MIDEAEFLRLVRDELSLPVADTGDLDVDLDAVPGWDSIHVLRLVVAMERRTGHRVPVGALLTQRTLRGIYRRATAAPD